MNLSTIRYSLVLCFLFFLSIISHAQEATQATYGVILDKATQEPLKGVVVELLNHIPIKTTTSNDAGEFNLKGIPVGKHRLMIIHEDYELVIVPEVQIQAGKSTAVNITLEKLPIQMKEVVVKATKIKKTTKDNPINHMALTGIRSFTIEEVKRYPASLDDPARLVSRFAGVSKVHSETGLIIRGHNSNSVLWRVEGLPIPSPNHLFFNEATTGYLPIFNIYLLRNSDFMHSTASAEYGNTIGGTLDLGLRSGNRNNYEGSFKFALQGLEAFAEGPLDKKGKVSFVAGGRYNWLSLITRNLSGIWGTIPNTNDFSFKININDKQGPINIFGIGGNSNVNIDVSVLDTNSVAARTLNDVTRNKSYLLLGASYRRYLDNKKGYIYTVLGGNYNLEEIIHFDSLHTYNKIRSRTLTTTLSSYLHYAFNPKHQLRVGITAAHYILKYQSHNIARGLTFRDYNGHSLLAQLHAQWLFKVTRKLKISAGVNGQYLLLNNSYGIGPRVAVHWQFLASHRLSFGYSWNHQMQPLETYFNISHRNSDEGEMVDFNTKFSQNHHLSLAYDWAIINNWRLKLEGYFQYLTNIPINSYQPNASFVNISSTENLLRYTHFENTGEGRIAGVEFTLEKFFSEGYYGLLTASYFDAKYKSSDGNWINMEANSNFISNLLIGKEFRIGKEKNNRLFMDVAYAIRLGNYYTPIDLAASQAANVQILDWDKAYSLKYPTYHQVDFRIGFVFNQKKKHVSHRLFIEAGNLLNQRIVYREIYNPYTRTIGQHSYLGLIVNISYRVNFAFKKKEATTMNATGRF